MPVSRPAVSQHLRVLKDARLVVDRPRGPAASTRSIATASPPCARISTSSGIERSPASSRPPRRPPAPKGTADDCPVRSHPSQQDPHRRRAARDCVPRLHRRHEPWWPMGSHHIGKAAAVAIVMEPFRGVDGTSVATMDRSAHGVASPRGSHRRASCSTGRSPPTGSSTKASTPPSRSASSPSTRAPRASSSSTATSTAMASAPPPCTPASTRRAAGRASSTPSRPRRAAA